MGHYDSCYEYDERYRSDPYFRKQQDDESKLNRERKAKRIADAKLEREIFKDRMNRILVH